MRKPNTTDSRSKDESAAALLLRQNFTNIGRKLQAGGTLNATEIKFLDRVLLARAVSK